MFHSKSRRPVAGAHAAARVAGSAVTSFVWSVAPGPFGPTYLYANAEELIKAAVRRSVNRITLCKVNFGGQLKVKLHTQANRARHTQVEGVVHVHSVVVAECIGVVL